MQRIKKILMWEVLPAIALKRHNDYHMTFRLRVIYRHLYYTRQCMYPLHFFIIVICDMT